ncbi:hypothetical protein C8R44DRAFT_750688 [Mycena epipterygia]|nr:hypothetical protein C8R44DRAFT_750688 [Mycena epipterygia]
MTSIARILALLLLVGSTTIASASPIVARTNAPQCVYDKFVGSAEEALKILESRNPIDSYLKAILEDCCAKHPDDAFHKAAPNQLDVNQLDVKNAANKADPAAFDGSKKLNADFPLDPSFPYPSSDKADARVDANGNPSSHTDKADAQVDANGKPSSHTDKADVKVDANGNPSDKADAKVDANGNPSSNTDNADAIVDAAADPADTARVAADNNSAKNAKFAPKQKVSSPAPSLDSTPAGLLNDVNAEGAGKPSSDEIDITVKENNAGSKNVANTNQNQKNANLKPSPVVHKQNAAAPVSKADAQVDEDPATPASDSNEADANLDAVPTDGNADAKVDAAAPAADPADTARVAADNTAKKNAKLALKQKAATPASNADDADANLDAAAPTDANADAQVDATDPKDSARVVANDEKNKVVVPKKNMAVVPKKNLNTSAGSLEGMQLASISGGEVAGTTKEALKEAEACPCKA